MAQHEREVSTAIPSSPTSPIECSTVGDIPLACDNIGSRLTAFLALPAPFPSFADDTEEFLESVQAANTVLHECSDELQSTILLEFQLGVGIVNNTLAHIAEYAGLLRDNVQGVFNTHLLRAKNEQWVSAEYGVRIRESGTRIRELADSRLTITAEQNSLPAPATQDQPVEHAEHASELSEAEAAWLLSDSETMDMPRQPHLLTTLLSLALAAVVWTSHGTMLSDVLVSCASLATIILLSCSLRAASEDLTAMCLRYNSHAVFGNPIESIIIAVLVLETKSSLLRTFLAGSIMKDMFLVGGVGLVASGFKHGDQIFRHTASLRALPIVLPISAILPFGLLPPDLKAPIESSFLGRSPIVAGSACVILIYLYGLFVAGKLFHTNKSQAGSLRDTKSSEKALPTVNLPAVPESRTQPSYMAILRSASIFALLVAVGVYVTFVLVGRMDGALKRMGMGPVFTSLILLPASCALPEIIAVISMARRSRVISGVMDIASISCLYTSILVAPCAAIISWLIGKPFSLIPSDSERLQSIVPFMAVASFAYMMFDGRANWFLGVTLLMCYCVILIPASCF